MKVVIVDYGMGNIKSITGALKYVGVDEILVSNVLQDILAADKLILPGVGAFSKAIENIKKNSLDKTLEEAVIQKKIPILGICLGMQLMGSSSCEGGDSHGLGFISGDVNRFEPSSKKIPHVGFNQVQFNSDSRLYRGLNDLSDFYFTHSFKMTSDIDINQAICTYGDEFVASYEVDNIAGVQFHPELSQTNGLRLLENFVEHF